MKQGKDMYRSQVGNLIGTWETAQTRGKRKRDEEADQHIGDLPRRLTDERHAAIVHGCEDSHHELKMGRGVPLSSLWRPNAR